MISPITQYDDSDTGMDTEEIIEEMDSNRSRMHKLLDNMLEVASSPSPSKSIK